MDQEIFRLILEPENRRCWLLLKALECAPLDRAIGLARLADDFASGKLEDHDETRSSGQKSTDIAQTRAPELGNSREIPALQNQTRLGLSDEQRDRLMSGMAAGATNAELAASFGLSARQVQGIRIGSARRGSQGAKGSAEPSAQGPINGHSDINGHSAVNGHADVDGDAKVNGHTKIHGHASMNGNTEPMAEAPDTPSSTQASWDEVVRYLRQQDDVVVSQGAGVFLVNGRFRLETAELLARANKMRARQAKPQFKVAAGEQRGRRHGLVNGHPLFWNGAATATEPAKSP